MDRLLVWDLSGLYTLFMAHEFLIEETDMEIDVISKQEVEQIALNTVCDYIKPEEWCEEGSIRQDIKDIKKHLDRHDDSLHNMYEAINAVSRMSAHHKESINKLEENDVLQKMIVVHKELIDALTKRIKVLEEVCLLKKK